MTAAAIDVLVPTVDRLPLLRRAVAGIVDQVYPGTIRTIVHFDGTVPVEDLVSHDPHRPVEVLANPPGRRGLAQARNTMFDISTADILAICDDDDAWLPGKIAAQMAVLDDDPEAEVVGTGMVVDGADTTLSRVWPHAVVTLDDLITSRVQDLHPSSLLLRRRVLDAVGGIDAQIPGSYGEDRDWMIRAARRTPIRMVQAPLVHVRWQQESLFAQKWATIIDAIDYLVAKHPEFATNNVGHARMRGRRAFALACLDRRAEARSEARSALRLSRSDLRAWAAIAVASRLCSPDVVQRLANAAGRGI